MPHRHHRGRQGLLTAVALLALITGASAADQDAAQLGTVQGDTLLVDLDRMIELALAHNEQLRAGGAMVDAAGARAAGSWQGFLPQVSVTEAFARTDNALMAFGSKLNRRAVSFADFGFGPDGPLAATPETLNEPGETNLWMTRLQLLQPVFNGGMAWYGKAAASAASDAARLDFARAAETVTLHCIQAYEGLTLALAYHDVMEAAIRSARAHERQAQSLLDNEMATEADLLQARVFLSSLEQQLIIVDNQVHQAGEMIRLLTTVETPLVLAAPRHHRAATAAATSPTLAEVHGRQDLLAHQARAQAAGHMVGVARGAMLPHLNLGLSKDWYSADSAFGNEADSWSLGVYATWDVFKGLANVSRLRQARAERRAAQHLYDFELRRARHDAEQAHRNVEAAAARVEVAGRAVDAARESLRIVTNQYREGLASMVDLLDVQAAAIRTEGDLVQARHDFHIEDARLAHAAGRDIQPGGNQ